jgi:transcriptional regulator with XRE-family HTH domain
MQAVRTAFEQSGLSQEELGLKMGYDPSIARKSTWQFLNKTNDPRFSMLRRFSEAIGVPVIEVLKLMEHEAVAANDD